MNSSATSNALRNERVFRTLSYTLVFLMVVCVIMAASSLIRNVIPEWHSGVMAGVMLLVVIERLYTYSRFKSLTVFSSEGAVVFGTQWIVFLIVIRLLLSYVNGLEAFLIDLQLFAQGYLERFFSAEFIVALFLAMLAWYIPVQFLELLDEMGLDQKLALRDDPVPLESGEASAQQRLVRLTFNLGIMLVLVTALASMDLRSVGAPGSLLVDPNRFSTGEAGVLLYFLFGLALLVQGRLMSLQTRWNLQRIPVSSENLGRQWGFYSLLFLFLLVLVISLLPAGDSLGIFSILAALIGFLLNVFLFIWRLIITVLFILLSIPFLLLRIPPPLVRTVPRLPDLPPPVEAPFDLGSSAAWILIRSILLWGSLILIVVFSITRFLKQHDDLRAALRKAPFLQWLVLAWEWLSRNAGRAQDGLRRVIAEGWQSLVTRLERRRSLPPAGWISLRSLDPRRRVYFFYLAMIRRSDQQGLTRKPSQTPAEFAATLEQGLPSVSEEIDALTKAFTEARYSRHAVDAQKANLVKATWERIRRALQNISNNEQLRK